MVTEPVAAASGLAATTRSRDLAYRLVRDAGPLLAEFGLPFVLVLYLALQSGGYSQVTSSEVGVIVWWLVLLGAVLGLLARGPMGRARWLAFGLLAAFAVWTALGFTWTESSEQTMVEVTRVLTYLGVLALALSNRGPGTIERVAAGVGAAIAIVALVALLSRLHPSWFPENTAADFLPITRERLSYPLGYWNGLAALIVMGIPIVLAAATYSRRLVTSALAAAVLPAMALTAFYTLSRGGAVELAVALTVLFLLAPRRLNLLPTLAITGAGAALLIVIATGLDSLEDGLVTGSAQAQGDEMLLLTLVVCTAVGFLQAAYRGVMPEGIGPVGRDVVIATAGIAGVAVVIGIASAVAAGAPDELSDSWQEFKSPTIDERGATRFVSASGTGRYQHWDAALDAGESEPLTGIGPGAYEFWWSRTNDLENFFVRDAHSLYLETFGEAGVVGLLILLAFIATLVWAAVSAARRSGRHRAVIAGVAASCAAYLTASAIDWVWELAAVTAAFLLLGGAILTTRDQVERDESEDREARRGLPGRVVLAAAAVVALVVIAIPLTAAKSITDSEQAVAAGDLDEALDKADDAAGLQPYAATPSLQRAIVLELEGDIDAAAVEAREASRQESTNWQTWLVLSRLEARLGNADEALAAYRNARSLNPQSPLFQP